MEYRIESSVFSESLQETVNEMLADGWECQGGLCVTSVAAGASDCTIYHQAMLKRKALPQMMSPKNAQAALEKKFG